MKQILKIILLFCSLNLSAVQSHATWNGEGGASMSEVIDYISNITCETQGVENFLMEPNAHTCIPSDLLTLYWANIVSPGIYYNMMIRLRIQDSQMFPNQCKREYRTSPTNPSIDFGLCSNAMMAAYRTYLMGQMTGGSIAVSATGGDAAEHFRKVMRDFNDPSRYTVIYRNQHDGNFGFFADASLLTYISGFPWQVIKSVDKICVETISVFGWIHVGCKWTREPFPRGFLSGFTDVATTAGGWQGGARWSSGSGAGFSGGTSGGPGSGSVSGTATAAPDVIPPDMLTFLHCSTAGGCASRAQEYSQAPLSISSSIIECLRDMISKMLISRNVCAMQSFDIASLSRTDSTLYQFQSNMRRAVMAFLTLYVMSVGFKILMGGAENMPKSNEAILLLIKFVLVIYFSVGISISSGTLRFDGMSELVFPILLKSSAAISSWFMNATPSGLCQFRMSDYPNNMGHLALWDSLDCKVIHYLGLDVVQTLFNNSNNFDPLGGSIPPYAIILIPAIIYKQVNLAILCIAYPLIVLSLAAFLVNAFAVCMIAIAILGMLAPIFVPFALFDGTKGYFQSWYNMLISFVLQPVVVICFMTLMFGVYDQSFYGNCKFQEIVLERTGAAGQTLRKKLFIVDTSPSSYGGSQVEVNACMQSIGYLFNQPLLGLTAMTRTGSGGQKILDLTSIGNNERNFAENLDRFTMLSSVDDVSGFFFNYISSSAAFAWNIIINLLVSILMLYLMYKLAGNLAAFAADIAQSPALQGVISPTGLADAGMGAAKEGLEHLKGKDGGKDDKGGSGESGKRGGGGGASVPRMGGSSGGGSSTPKMG